MDFVWSMNLDEAFQFARDYHTGQNKKGTNIPFIYHPMAVASWVLKFGGTERQAMAALLHDTIADGKLTQSFMESKFGAEVTKMVFGFMDPEVPEGAHLTWAESKKTYLKKVSELEENSLMVIACEEFHEGTELIQDLRYQGISVWKRYPVHSMEVFWYFRELLQIFNQRLTGEKYRPLVAEFARLVLALKGIIFENNSP